MQSVCKAVWSCNSYDGEPRVGCRRRTTRREGSNKKSGKRGEEGGEVRKGQGGIVSGGRTCVVSEGRGRVKGREGYVIGSGGGPWQGWFARVDEVRPMAKPCFHGGVPPTELAGGACATRLLWRDTGVAFASNHEAGATLAVQDRVSHHRTGQTSLVEISLFPFRSFFEVRTWASPYDGHTDTSPLSHCTRLSEEVWEVEYDVKGKRRRKRARRGGNGRGGPDRCEKSWVFSPRGAIKERNEREN